MQDSEPEGERCDCGGDHGDAEPITWADTEPYLKQYVYDVLSAESAETVRRGSADMIDASGGIDDLEAQLAQLTDVMSEHNAVSMRRAIETLRLPVAATTVRLVEAFAQARTRLHGEPTSRWGQVPESDRDFVISALAKCSTTIDAELAQSIVRAEVVGEAFAALESVSAAVAANLASSFQTLLAMNVGAGQRSVAIGAACDVLDGSDGSAI